jgi:hypothetical protein
MKSFICFILSCLLMISCGKKETKNPPRCIYDQAVFTDAARSAVSDGACFVHFKQNPFFNLLWENLSEGEGAQWLKTIEEKYPFLKEKFEDFRAVDCIGSPRVFAYAEAGTFSPSTLRLIALGGELHSKMGDWRGLHGIQIGAGCGGLCSILHSISEFASYTVVDLPAQLELARKCLEGMKPMPIVYLTPQQLPQGAVYDLVISDRSFSEFNRSHQELFFDRILSCSHSGFLLGHVFPKHYGVVPMNFEELKERLQAMEQGLQWEAQEPTLEKNNYFIFFKKNKNVVSR